MRIVVEFYIVSLQRAISSHVEEDYESSEEEEEMNDEQIINSMTKAFKGSDVSLVLFITSVR